MEGEEESSYENVQGLRSVREAQLLGRRGKGEEAEAPICSGAVHSLLTQYYKGEKGIVFQKAKVRSYY